MVRTDRPARGAVLMPSRARAQLQQPVSAAELVGCARVVARSARTQRTGTMVRDSVAQPTVWTEARSHRRLDDTTRVYIRLADSVQWPPACFLIAAIRALRADPSEPVMLLVDAGGC